MMADNYNEQLVKWCCRDLAKPRSTSASSVRALQYYFRPVILECFLNLSVGEERQSRAKSPTGRASLLFAGPCTWTFHPTERRD